MSEPNTTIIERRGNNFAIVHYEGFAFSACMPRLPAPGYLARKTNKAAAPATSNLKRR